MIYEKNVEIQRKIKEERLRQGVSIRRLAKMMECSPRAISLWEAEERAISIEMADRALKVLGVAVEIGKNKTKGVINEQTDNRTTALSALSRSWTNHTR